MISSTVGGTSGGLLALSAVSVTANLTSKMLRAIADTLDSPSLLVVGDLIIYAKRPTPDVGDLLSESKTEAILEPLFGRETTQAFFSLLEDGYLHNSSFEINEGGVKLGKHVPSLFQYETPAPPDKASGPYQPRPKSRPNHSERRPTKSERERARMKAKRTAPMAELYAPTEEIIASIAPRIVPITNPNIAVEELRHIPKRYFDRAVFLALRASRQDDGSETPIRAGQEIWLMAGSGYEKKGQIEGCLLISTRCPRSRKGMDYPKVRLRFYHGRWVVQNELIRGRRASDMMHDVLTLTDWGLVHNGQAFPDTPSSISVSKAENDRRKALLSKHDLIYHLNV